MKLSKKKIIYFLYTLLVLVRMNFFYLGITLPSWTILFLMMTVTLVCCIFCYKIIIIIRNNMKYAYRYCCFSLVSCFLIFLYTLYCFPIQGVSATLGIALPYVSIILFFPITILLFYYNGADNLFAGLNIIALVWYVILLIQSLVYSRSGIVFLNGYFSDWAATRNGLIRINLYEFGNIMILYNFHRFYCYDKKNNKKMFHIICFVLGMCSLLFVQQTRMYYIVIFSSLLVVVLVSGRGSHRRIIRNIILCLLCVVIILSTEVVQNIIGSFSIQGENAFSTSNRLYEIDYYWHYFLVHPIFGMGYAHSYYYPFVVRGHNQLAATSDVGIVGQIGKIGLFAFPIYFGYCIRLISIMSHIGKKMDRSIVAWYYSLLVYVLISSFTLIILDQDRYLLYPLIFSLFEYEEYNMKHSCKFPKNTLHPQYYETI